ncbi:MAG TPA: PDZ domain-containing protein [Bryobacteraceae bacterium]|nr:PDZ domain-containing protein [Bryobacteraceae bacterium]
MVHKMTKLILAALLLAAALPAQNILPQFPALSADSIVFSYAGDLWRVAREGGVAVRLTTHPGRETTPVFSPDGRTIAFLGAYDGNTDVFTIPVVGGVPKRLTSHPGADAPVAFTTDGKRLLIRSPRSTFAGSPKFFTIALDGGPAEELPLPMGFEASYSNDGTRLAYTPLTPAFTIWKRYRGGRTSKIWIAQLSDSKVEEIPRSNSNDFNPMFTADRVYFLSDRNGPITLFSYDLKTKKVTEAFKNTAFDYKSASLGPGAIVLERFGGLELFDLKSGKVSPVKITINGDLTEVRPYYDKVGSKIVSVDISPTGARAIFEARGDIFTVPAEKGDIRNLTTTSGVAERFPAWSPDGQSIAFLSDATGEYQIHIAPQNGLGEVKKYDAGAKTFLYLYSYSPDGKKLLIRDAMLRLGIFDIDSAKTTWIEGDYYDSPLREEINPSWSPDSKWILYTKQLKNQLRAVCVYSLESAKETQLTDGLSDARHARFDPNGKYIYFTASTNQGLSTGWLDMSSMERVQNRSAYLIVLKKDEPSPLAPESDEEKAADKKDDKSAAKPDAKQNDKPDAKKDEKKDVVVAIDFDGISQRILALPVPARDYTQLDSPKTGVVYLLEDPPAAAPGPTSRTLHKFDLKTRKTDKVMEGVGTLAFSRNGEKMVFRQGERWAISATSAPPKPGEGTIKTADMEALIDPVAEWKQMFYEVWRLQRDFLYAPNFHGLDLDKAKEKYASYLSAVAHRADLNYLFGEMLGEISVGHMYVAGGAFPEVKSVPVGLLGTDYKVENGRYRFARVYDGENWNPSLRAPLTQPGVNVKAGEYLLAVNGRNVTANDDVYRFFEAMSGKSVVIKVGPNPTTDGAREVTVVPVANESGLRYMAWVEDNRRKVEQLSGGRLGYVHLPNTSDQGYSNFNRWFFAQVGKEGMVLDERFNGGGSIADYIVDYLRRPLLNFFSTRAGHDFTTPMNAVFGPKVMIVNEFAGSGGDAMPWMFRKLKVGPLVGMRTWGGLVGIFGYPALIDGGRVTAPNLAFYNTEGQWDVENHGVDPDIVVDYDPALVRQGKDPQLEKAVVTALEQLQKSPLPKYQRPAYPDYHNKR